MNSTVETLSPTRVRLAIEVPFDELRPGLDAAYKKLGSQLRIPGFRPGKVPARIIDQRVGRAAVLEEAVNELLPRAYSEAAREHDLRPLGQPEVEVTKLVDDEPIEFTAEVDIRPEVTLPDLDGIELSVDDSAVTDADIDAQVDGLRDRFGTLTGVERPVQLGDYVSLDLAALVDGEPIDEANAKGMSYEVGSGNLLDGLDEAIIGTSAGETATLTSEIEFGDRAGETAEFSATVNSVKVKELPELDDEFAQLASEFDTVDELRDDLRSRLVRVKALEQGAQARDKLVEHLVAAADFPLPESAVKAEVDFREHEIVHSLGHDDAMLDRYLTMQGKTREEFTAELRESAERAVRIQFILDATADQMQIQIADGELAQYLVRQAARYEMAPQEFANQVVEAGNLPALIADVRRNKALAAVLEASVVTDASGRRVDLSALAPGALAELMEEDDGDDDDDDDEGVYDVEGD